MFDANYFRSTLARDVAAAGGKPIVEVQLVGGQTHRVRNVSEIGEGFVTLETYQAKGDLAHERPRFGDAASASGGDTVRAIIAYESIAAVILDAAPEHARVRPGFISG